MKWLQLPVVLVIDGILDKPVSAAALVHGFQTFDPALTLAGVIFNKVAGTAHYRLLRDAVMSGTAAVPLGYLPRDERIRIPERYLGLFTAGEDLLPDAMFELLGELTEKTIDLDELLESAASFPAPAKGIPHLDANNNTRWCGTR